MSTTVQFVIVITIITLILLSNTLIKYPISRLIIKLYLIFWLIVLLVSTINPYGLYDVSPNTYMLLLLGIVMFTFGYLFTGLFEKKAQPYHHNNKTDDTLFRNKIFILLVVFFLVVLIYFVVKYIDIVKVNLVSDISADKYSRGALFESGASIYFYDMFVCSFSVACTYIAAYMIIFWQKKNYLLVAAVIAIPVLNSTIGATRGGFFDLILAIGLFYLIKRVLDLEIVSKRLENKDGALIESHTQLFHPIYGGHVSNSSKAKKKRTKGIWLIGIVMFLFIASSGMTAIRENQAFSVNNSFVGMESLTQSIVVYAVAPFRAFEYGLVLFPQSIGWGYGQGTFTAAFSIFNAMLKTVGLHTIGQVNYGQLFQATILSVGINNTHYNYAFTYLMTFYLDFGIFGIILFSFLYGCLMRTALNRFKLKPNIFSFILIGTLFNTILFAVFSWRLQLNYTVIVIAICFILSRRIIHSRKVE